MFLEQFCACLSAFKLDTFSVSHGKRLYAGIPHSLLNFTLAQGPESAHESGASAFALLVSCRTCLRFVFRTFVIYLLKLVGFSGEPIKIPEQRFSFFSRPYNRADLKETGDKNSPKLRPRGVMP